MYLLSIIIPVYNAEKYINFTLESILKQSFKDYEIILIDDGSNDNSKIICRNYIKKNESSRIILIEIENGGVSNARNIGLRHARGEYVFFIDADDLLFDECLCSFDKLQALSKPDIILLQVHTFDQDVNNNKRVKPLTLPILNIETEIYSLIKNNYFLYSPCDKIVKKSILVDNNIFFPEKIPSREDFYWNFLLIPILKTYEYIPKPFYFYRKGNVNSASSSLNETKIISGFNVCKLAFNQIETWSKSSNLDARLIILDCILANYFNIFFLKNKSEVIKDVNSLILKIYVDELQGRSNKLDFIIFMIKYLGNNLAFLIYFIVVLIHRKIKLVFKI